MKFINDLNTFKKLYEKVNKVEKLKSLFIGTCMDRYNTYSEQGKEAIIQLLNNTADDVITNLITYIGDDESKSLNFLTKITDGLKKTVLSGIEPSKFAYYTNKQNYINDKKLSMSNFTTSTKQVNIQPSEYAIIPLSQFFANNSYKMSTESLEEIKSKISKIGANIDKSKPIIIKASCSTLRNTGDASNLTWFELSTKRTDDVKNLITSLIPNHKIEIDVKGGNGDGTTGNKSPLEEVIPSKGVVIPLGNNKSITGDGIKKYYELMNLDAKFWKSASTLAPLGTVKPDFSDIQNLVENISPLYDKFKFVNILIPTLKEYIPDFKEELNINFTTKPNTITTSISNNIKRKGKYKGFCPL
jgi:hypothetical protein